MAWYASGVRVEATQLRQNALADYGGEQVQVFIATRDIAVGETLSAQNSSSELWLADLLPSGALTTVDEVYGKTVVIPLLANEPIIQAKIGELASPVSVPDDLCAVSIPSEDVLAVGGAIRPGSVVAVYAVGVGSVELIAQDILVLETSNSSLLTSSEETGVFGGGSTRKSLTWVTLAVEPELVQGILAASRDKNLYLVLPGAAVDVGGFVAPWSEGDPTQEAQQTPERETGGSTAPSAGTTPLKGDDTDE